MFKIKVVDPYFMSYTNSAYSELFLGNMIKFNLGFMQSRVILDQYKLKSNSYYNFLV